MEQKGRLPHQFRPASQSVSAGMARMPTWAAELQHVSGAGGSHGSTAAVCIPICESGWHNMAET